MRKIHDKDEIGETRITGSVGKLIIDLISIVYPYWEQQTRELASSSLPVGSWEI